MEEQSYTSTHTLGHTGPVTGSFYLYGELGVSRMIMLGQIFKEMWMRTWTELLWIGISVRCVFCCRSAYVSGNWTTVSKEVCCCELVFCWETRCTHFLRRKCNNCIVINRVTPNDPYMGRTAPLTSKRCILYIYSINKGTEYFKHALFSPFFSLQNAVCFVMLTCLVPVLFTFYIQSVLKLKKKIIPAPKG